MISKAFTWYSTISYPPSFFFKQSFMVEWDLVSDIVGLLGVQVHCIPSLTMQPQQTNILLGALCKDNL